MHEHSPSAPLLDGFLAKHAQSHKGAFLDLKWAWLRILVLCYWETFELWEEGCFHFKIVPLGLGVFQNIFRNANIQSRVTFDWSRIDHLDLKSRFKAFFKISPLLTSSSYQQRFKGDSLTCKGLRLWLDLRRLLLMVEIEGVELCCVSRLSRPVLKPACTHSGAVSCPTSCSGARCVERASFSLGL